jgi:hypothetical protein
MTPATTSRTDTAVSRMPSVMNGPEGKFSEKGPASS